MVHSGGQQGRDAGHAARSAAARKWRLGAGARRAGLAVFMLAVVAVAPARAQAAIGFQGGFAVDPEQVFGGVFFQTDDIGRGIRLRPGVDGGVGDGLRIANLGVDFVYGYPLGNNGWTFLAGGGPTVVITRFADFDDERDTSVGFHSLVGFGHDSGFFTELRLGSGRTQQLKLGVGWAITLH